MATGCEAVATSLDFTGDDVDDECVMISVIILMADKR